MFIFLEDVLHLVCVTDPSLTFQFQTGATNHIFLLLADLELYRVVIKSRGYRLLRNGINITATTS